MLSPVDGKPVMVDDTCNFISCRNESEADILFSLLTDERTKTFLDSINFWDSKRPITTEILNLIDLKKIARENYMYQRYSVLMNYNKTINNSETMQMQLF
jgi:hypothetical protein